MPPTQVQGVLEHELGAPLKDVFEWIDLQTPLGSASISQVRKDCCTLFRKAEHRTDGPGLTLSQCSH